MTNLLLRLIYLLTYWDRIPNARCLVADDGLVSMVWYSDEDQILLANLYVFKGY